MTSIKYVRPRLIAFMLCSFSFSVFLLPFSGEAGDFFWPYRDTQVSETLGYGTLAFTTPIGALS